MGSFDFMSILHGSIFGKINLSQLLFELFLVVIENSCSSFINNLHTLVIIVCLVCGFSRRFLNLLSFYLLFCSLENACGWVDIDFDFLLMLQRRSLADLICDNLLDFSLLCCLFKSFGRFLLLSLFLFFRFCIFLLLSCPVCLILISHRITDSNSSSYNKFCFFSAHRIYFSEYLGMLLIKCDSFAALRNSFSLAFSDSCAAENFTHLYTSWLWLITNELCVRTHKFKNLACRQTPNSSNEFCLSWLWVNLVEFSLRQSVAEKFVSAEWIY